MSERDDAGGLDLVTEAEEAMGRIWPLAVVSAGESIGAGHWHADDSDRCDGCGGPLGLRFVTVPKLVDIEGVVMLWCRSCIEAAVAGMASP